MDKPLTKQHVFIAIPTTGMSVTNEISSLCEAALLMNYAASAPWTFTVRRRNGAKGVEYARNLLVGEFLESDATKLWFIDQDTRPSANSFELLLLDAYDIVAGVYPAFQRRDGGEPSLTFGVYHKEPDGWRTDPLPEGGNPIIECDAVMMGATVLKRRVLTDDRLLLGKVTDKAAPPLFQTPRAANGKMESTEDTDFCERARALGYRIACHANVKWGHLKEMDLLTVAKMMISAYRKGMDDASEPPLILKGN